MSKFKSKKITVDGICFSSKVEAKYYNKLKMDKAKGLIENFELQPKYILQEKFINAFGKQIRAITYVADFLVYNLDNTLTVIDIKGYPTQEARLKRKIWEYVYNGEELLWLCWYGKEWITFEEMIKIAAARKKEKKLNDKT